MVKCSHAHLHNRRGKREKLAGGCDCGSDDMCNILDDKRSDSGIAPQVPPQLRTTRIGPQVVFVLIGDQQLTRSIKLQSSSADLLVLNKRLFAKAIANCTELMLDQRNWPQARASTGQKRSPAVAFQNVVLTGKSLQCTC